MGTQSNLEVAFPCAGASSQPENIPQPVNPKPIPGGYQPHHTPVGPTPYAVSDPRSPQNAPQASQPVAPQQLPGPPEQPAPWNVRPPLMGHPRPGQGVYQQPVQQFRPSQQYPPPPNVMHHQITPGAYPGLPPQHPQQPGNYFPLLYVSAIDRICFFCSMLSCLSW